MNQKHKYTHRQVRKIFSLVPEELYEKKSFVCGLHKILLKTQGNKSSNT